MITFGVAVLLITSFGFWLAGMLRAASMELPWQFTSDTGVPPSSPSREELFDESRLETSSSGRSGR